MSTPCIKCKSTQTTAALLQNAALEPKRSSTLLGAVAKVELTAHACADCGHVELTADPARIKILAAAD